ncbi:MAG: ABC transporter ATP-binding protein [Oscillospiraceae bacterium]|jgi:branched-chain amino acid transport system ATP-binding protein|nr:ABC transporter ATP-binding protein [Oscillospiraceae bacterium]
MSGKIILEGKDLVKSFGGRHAVDHVDFHLNDGEILGLIGPNGAGKTTLFNLISGALTIDSGLITLFGQKISGKKPYTICRMGIARTFQAAKNFPGMSVYENLLISAQFGQKNVGASAAKTITDEIIEFTALESFIGKNIKDMPLAGQKRLEVARALATKPKILLIDEVMAGLNPSEVDEAIGLVRKINDSGITVIMIEHVMKAIMSVCGRIMVLHHGQNLAEGTPEEVSSNAGVIEVYLGG